MSLKKARRTDYITTGLVARLMQEIKASTLTLTLANFLNQERQFIKQIRTKEKKPTAAHLELTSYCHGGCNDCYIPLEERADPSVMSQETLEASFDFTKSFGIRLYDFIGGEPLTDSTIPLIRSSVMEHPLLIFHCCSNGQYLAAHKEELTDLITRPNLIFGLSINGFQNTNDITRFPGSFDAVLEAAEYLHSMSCFYGAIATLLPKNIEEAMSEEFIDFLIDNGFIFLNYSFPDGLEEGLKEGSRRRIKEMSRKPITIYADSKGRDDSDTDIFKRYQSVYIDKNGNILNDRKERVVIGNVHEGLEQTTSSEVWREKFYSNGLI